MRRGKRIAVVTAIVVAAVFFEAPPKGATVFAAPSDTQQQIHAAEQERQEIAGQLEGAQENLDNLQDAQDALKNELKGLNAKLSEISENLAVLEQQIRDKEQEIADTQAALDEARATEEWQYESMIIRMRKMYEVNDSDYVGALIGSGSLSDLLNAADRFEAIAAYDQRQLEEFKQNRQFIEEEEARLQREHEELEDLRLSVETEKDKVSGLISNTSSNIASYGEQIEQAEKEALAYEQALKAKEEELGLLKKKLAEEIALSQAAANASWRDISEVSFAEGDLKLLANLIYCEAGGEPYAGQLAVGSVVINRVLSSRYPDTVLGVIYQKSQFSPVGSGRLELALTYDRATADCYRAAEEAMSGVTNVGNCVYFRTPIPGLTGINIGGHVFY